MPSQKEIQIVQPDPVYCSECGSQYTEIMLEQLKENGIAYCVFCGKGYKSIEVKAEQY
jgi:DNA-directed RNA polymerase subunit RPC12/RpoP